MLDTLINVTCRVLNVQQGESVAEYSHDLANHFKKHGTPVMIGKWYYNICDTFTVPISILHEKKKVPNAESN